ncbi:MAG: SirB2 family protein [Chromatiales bacterium]|nr:SirB2 family protein [Chromatiales bacterium]
MDLKLVHAVIAAASVLLFVIRGLYLIASMGRARGFAMRALPPIVDTLLLASGIWLAVKIGFDPARDTWLDAKLAGVVAYIVLGILAFRGRTRGARVTAFVLALVAVAYVYLTAMHRTPLPLV